MNFEFSEDQNMLREQAQSFLRDKCDSRTVRAVLEGDDAYDANLWKAIVEMGWTATTIPEAYGGLGLGHLELCVIAEELGRVLAPTPFSSSVYLATEALIQFGSEEQKQAYLPKLAAGELIGTLALSEGTHAATAKNLQTSVEGGRVSGTKIPVPDGDVADFAIVVASDGAGTSMQLVDLTGADFEVYERALASALQRIVAKDFDGTLQCDGYGAYPSPTLRTPICRVKGFGLWWWGLGMGFGRGGAGGERGPKEPRVARF